jgi:hypothetical protein
MKEQPDTKLKHSSGFAITAILLLLTVVIGVVSIYLFVQARQTKNVSTQEQTIATYDECVAAGGVPRTNFDIGSYICYLTTKRNSAYPAVFERCTSETCPDLREAFLHFCNNEYAKSINKSGEEFLLAYAASAKVKKSYARGDIHCYHESEDDLNNKESKNSLYNRTPLHVFLHETENGWVFEKTVSDSFECKDFDGTKIPVAIVGPCYDASTGSFRGPR